MKKINNEISRFLLMIGLGWSGLNVMLYLLYSNIIYETGENISYFPFYSPILMSYVNMTIAFAVSFVLLILILCSSGHYINSDEIKLNFFDKMPLDLILFIEIFAVMLSINLFAEWLYFFTDHETVTIIRVVIWLYIVLYAVGITLLNSIVVRFKAKTIIKNNLSVKFIIFCYKLSKKIINYILDFIKRQISLVEDFFASSEYSKIIILSAGALAIIEFILLFVIRDLSTFILMNFIIAIVCVLFFAKTIVGMDRVRKAIIEVKNGNIHFKANFQNINLFHKKQLEDLVNINIGIRNAVNNEIKSERLKTELITNVSHDIKTPLTSIINYVDLIKKEDTNSETVKEYLAVVDKQSLRLKKMVEDLVEASKASTGNITPEMEKTNISMLLSQALAEYQDLAEKNNLILLVDIPQEDIYANCDGKLLWRIFDNLLSNVIKYSLPYTRVYINLEQQTQNIKINFKNISSTQLNISPDELTQRFVRGDDSRNTEGSGLGLSIAQSFMELMGGKLDIEIDGDLYKAILTFERA